jgi:TetR/AcrR family transcriptional repressor of nem operon
MEVMARPCEFDRSEVVAAAMKVFLSKGYEATSIDDLTTTLGISRASLYNSFGDKRGLLMAAFCCAGDEGRRMRESALSNNAPVREVLRSFLESIVKMNRSQKAGRGCFFLTLGAELASTDPDVSRWVREVLDEHREMFATLLRRAQKSGELQAGADVGALAAALTGTLVSILTLVRVHPEPDLLRNITDQAIAAVR